MFRAHFKHEESDFDPFLSAEAIQYHYGKHHIGYAENLNLLIKDTKYQNLSLEKIIMQSRKVDRKVFDNASQLFNHDFYWKCVTKKINILRVNY